MRRIATIAVFSGLLATMTACSEYGFPSAVFLEGGTPKVAVKACKDLRGITKIAVLRGRYGDERLREVWVARLQPGATPLFEFPLRGSIPGYSVTARQTFEPSTYYVVESFDRTGQRVDGPQFRFGELEEGRVEAYDAGTQDFRVFSLRNWRLTKEDCPEIRKSEATEFGSFGLIILGPILITAAAFALELRRRKRLRNRPL
jgi:hypothetical protein